MQDNDKSNITLLKRALEAITVLDDKLKGKNDLAIIGMACRFPGGANSPEEYWNLLSRGVDCISEIPSNRWDIEKYYDPDETKPGKSYVKRAGIINQDIKMFDPMFFGISAKEAMELDPQQRLLLEVGWEAVERAGQSRNIRNSKTGVFVGISGNDFAAIERDEKEVSAYTATGISGSVASGRVARAFGITGPAVSIDTACSSSLTAFHLGCNSIREGECDMALVGGVNVLSSPNSFVMLSKIKALSKDGECRVFSEDANGYARAEGCGMVVIKRLDHAIRDHDNILCTILGSGLNQDGMTSGLTVPNGLSQRQLLNDVIMKSHIKVDDVTFLETHGTGTVLGDPIEVRAIGEAYGERKKPLYLGAVKSNIGHLEAAAGMASLIKCILCIQNKQIPPNLHFTSLNKRINLGSMPIEFPTKLIDWTEEKRIAAVSAFGFSGTNAHVIIGEPPKKAESEKLIDRPYYLFTLSAKDWKALHNKAELYLQYLKANPQVDLGEICYCANKYNEHFIERKGYVVKDKNQLIDELQDFINDKENPNISRKTNGRVSFVVNWNSKISEELIQKMQKIESFKNHYYSCIKLFHKQESVETKFSYFYALFVTLREWGIVPVALYGEKEYELVMGVLAGVLSLEQAVQIIEHNDNDNICVKGESKDSDIYLLENSENRDMSYWLDYQQHYDKLENAVSSCKKNGYSHIIVWNDDKIIYQEMSNDKEYSSITYAVGNENLESFYQLLVQLYNAGIMINWDNLEGEHNITKIVFPTYPYQRKEYWVNQVEQELIVEEEAPLKGKAIESPINMKQMEFHISRNNFPEIIDNKCVLHVGYYLEMLCYMMKKLYHSMSYDIKQMKFYQALYLSTDEVQKIMLICEENENDEYTHFRFYSKNKNEESWNLHTEGLITKLTITNSKYIECSNKKRIIESGTYYNYEDFYSLVLDQGFKIGKAVKWVKEAWKVKNEVIARFLPSINDRDYCTCFHPGIYDACAQLFLLAGKNYIDDNLFMVINMDDFKLFNLNTYDDQNLWIYLKVEKQLDQESVLGNYIVFDDQNAIVVEAQKIIIKLISRERSDSFRIAMTSSENIENDLAVRLKNLDDNNKEAMLYEYLRELLSNLLKFDVEEIKLDGLLIDYGLDSLISLELKKAIQENIHVEVPMQYLIQGPSVRELIAKIIEIDSGNSPDSDNVWYSDTYSLEPSMWIYRKKRKMKPRLRVYCFPYGVAGASLFKNWEGKLPEEIEICPIQLPGKENRIKEKPIDDLEELIEVLYQVLSSELDIPYMIYGHSVGALIAFRLAHKLVNEQCNNPLALLVGAYTAPSIEPNPVYGQVMEALKGVGITDLDHLDQLYDLQTNQIEFFEESFFTHFNTNMNEDIRQTMKPVAFSEFRMISSYHFDESETKLSIPIVAFHGKDDNYVSISEMQEWEKLTSSTFYINLLEGDHYFLHEDQSEDELLKIIQELSRNLFIEMDQNKTVD